MLHESDSRQVSMRDRIRAEQVRALFEHTPAAVFSHLYFASVVVSVLWQRASRELLFAWLAAVVIACGIRYASTWVFRRRARAASHWRLWSAIGAALITLFGMLWGAAAILFLDLDDTLNVAVIVAIIAGLSSAAAATTASSPASFYGFFLASYVPMMGVFLAQGSQIGVALAALALAAMVTVPMVHRRVNRELEETLRLGFENEALRQEADDANAAKTRFIAAASHDLRQPIHALELSLGVLSERVQDPAARPIIERLEGSVNAVDSLLGSLLDISKLDAGVMIPKPEPIAVDPLFHVLETEFQPAAAEGGNALHSRSIGGWVFSDPVMLCCILRNLLSNALCYTTRGRVLLTARRRQGRMRFEVKDSGVGIPGDRLDDVFKEFQQIGSHEHDRKQGLGLGLAIVKRLAGLLKHPIGVRSAPGAGSCFWIDVPMTDAPVVPSLAAEAPVGMSGGQLRGSRVLVLDDDLVILRSMRELMQSWGCDVVTATSIASAEAGIRSHAPELVIVDYRLTDEETGLQALARLQALAERRLPALIITADTAPERLREARDSGYLLLHKPVQPARLRSAMQYLLQQAEPRHSCTGADAALCSTRK
jgi:signal transduction histidine kinase/CheY-like chemotaxis protein